MFQACAIAANNSVIASTRIQYPRGSSASGINAAATIRMPSAIRRFI